MKLKKLKLNQIADTTLNEREMLRLFGAGCQCGCHFAGSGGSSSSDNSSANSAHGYGGTPGDYCPGNGNSKCSNWGDCSGFVNTVACTNHVLC